MRYAFPGCRRPGFTLVEVLVATAISVILVLGVVRIASDSLRAYDKAVAVASVTATARTVLDTLESDLQGALLRDDGKPWLECMPARTESGAQDLNTQSNVARGADMQLMFFGTPSDRDRTKPRRPNEPIKGDVCAIRYQLRLRNPLPQELQGDPTVDRAYCLTRTVINSEDTFNLTLPSTQADDAKGLFDAYWKSGPAASVPTAPVDQKSTQPQQYFTADLLANNVLGFTPIFIFKATKTESDGTTTPYQYYIAPEPENTAQDPAAGLNPGGGAIAYADPDNPTRAPGANNLFRANLKIAAAWCARDLAGAKNSELAALPANVNKAPGRLCAVVIALVVIDDTGADKLRELMNQNGGNPRVPEAEFDKVYAEHARVFTRRVNLPGR